MAETVKKSKAPAKPAAEKKNAAKSKAAAEKSESGPIAVPAKPRAAAAKTNGVGGTVTSSATAKPRQAAAKPEAPAEVTGQPTHPVHAGHSSAPSPEQVAQLAHRYWIERGRHHGSHEQDWLRAEQELRGKAS